MAGKTPRFGFNYFGSGTPGTISDDGQKFTSLDRLTLDRLLAATEKHDHKYHPPETGMATAPTGVLVPSSGTLVAGYTYRYRVGLVDLQGNESIASPELSVSTPTPLTPPGLPGLYHDDVTPGSLLPTYYYYALTGHRGGEESTLGQAAMISLGVGDGSVTLDLPTYGAADSFSIWRMGSTEPGFTRIGLVSIGETSFVDDGSTPADPCACDPGVAPPSSNTGVSSYSVVVSLPDGTVMTNVQSWKLYRTVYAGIYNAASLVHNVVEREDEWDQTSPLQTSWTDTGRPLVAGKPMDTDQNMRFLAFTFDSAADALPDPVGYPLGYPMIFDEGLYVLTVDGWTAVSSPAGGGGGGGMAPVMTAPDGSRWSLSVGNSGVLTTTSTVLPGPPSAPVGLSVA